MNSSNGTIPQVASSPRGIWFSKPLEASDTSNLGDKLSFTRGFQGPPYKAFGVGVGECVAKSLRPCRKRRRISLLAIGFAWKPLSSPSAQPPKPTRKVGPVGSKVGQEDETFCRSPPDSQSALGEMERGCARSFLAAPSGEGWMEW